jgi:hypothetical protein
MPAFEEYRNQVLKIIFAEIQSFPDILAAWEGGSAANGSQDQFSDIDLCILSKEPVRSVLDRIEATLNALGVSHTWQPHKSSWGDGLQQRVIVLKNAPKHFSVDVAVFDINYPDILKDFLEIERHGKPLIYFDKVGAIKPTHANAEVLFEQHQKRVDDLAAGFRIFKTLVLKEIDRIHPIDAIGFYQTGLVRPLVEIMGMIYRPYRADFGQRYLHKDFPIEEQKLIEQLNYVASFEELPLKLQQVEAAFNRVATLVKQKTKL